MLLVVAINLSWLLAATQLDPRSLYEVANPPIDPVSIENNLRSRNLSDKVPLAERWLVWSSGIVLEWDWGQSPRGGHVQEEIDRRIWVSVRLITLGSLLGAALGVLIGTWTAARQYKLSDRVLTFVALLGLSVPSFVIASVLQMLATWFNNKTGTRFFEFVGETGARGDWFGADVVDRFQHLMLPTIALTILGAAFFSRIQRSVMLDSLSSDYVRTARAKGLRKSQAIIRHALRMSLIPTSTYFAFSVATLFVGACVHGNTVFISRHGRLCSCHYSGAGCSWCCSNCSVWGCLRATGCLTGRSDGRLAGSANTSGWSRSRWLIVLKSISQ